VNSVSEYLHRYSDALSDRIDELHEPLHYRGQAFDFAETKRQPKRGQTDAIAALVKAMRAGEKTVNMVGALGSGKTTVAAIAVHTHARGRPYRCIVMCPPHLPRKWKRELLDIVPQARVQIVERYTDLVRLASCRAAPIGAEFYIVSESMAKLAPAWKPSVVVRRNGLACGRCYSRPMKKIVGDETGLEPMSLDDLGNTKTSCSTCGEPLWQWVAKPSRWPIATYAAKKMRGMFDYAVIDEVHEASGSNTAIAIAASKIVSMCKHVIPLTGTYVNGYAHGIMHLLWRSAPTSLQTMGFEYGQTSEFAKKYGRLEKTIRTKVPTYSNRQSSGSKGRTTVKVRPGVMPTIFGDHLLGKCVFLGLEDICDDLPQFTRGVSPVHMESEQFAAYREIEEAAASAMHELIQSGNMRAISQLIRCMIDYPDHPNGYGPIGYEDEDQQWREIIEPRSLKDQVWPKDRALIDLVRSEVSAGRKCWVFAEMTQKRDVQRLLQAKLERVGIRTAVLRSGAVPTKKREEWIAKHAPGVDCIISHPRLVAVGLDFFQRDPRGGYLYNFPTLAFYQTSMQTSVVRQASGRAFRIGQELPCKVIHFHYEECLEQKMVNLMGAKIQASEAIDGKFSSDGLSALSDTSDAMGMALAKSLVASMQKVVA